MLEVTLLSRPHALSFMYRELAYRKNLDGNRSIWNHLFCFKPKKTTTKLKSNVNLSYMCTRRPGELSAGGPHTGGPLVWSPELLPAYNGPHLLWPFCFFDSLPDPDFCSKRNSLFLVASQQAALPAWLFKDVVLCDLLHLRVSLRQFFWPPCLQLPTSSPPSSCSGILLSSSPYTARQAVSLQRASIHSVLVGWLHSSTWVDRYKRTSQMLGTKCWQGDGINTKPFASDHQGWAIGASSPSVDDLLILSLCKCFDMRETVWQCPLKACVSFKGLLFTDSEMFLQSP